MDDEALSEGDWVQLVKRTREKFGVSITEAHDLIFEDETVRRLVAIRINRIARCRALAFKDMRERGEQSRFVKVNGKIYFRDSEPDAS